MAPIDLSPLVTIALVLTGGVIGMIPLLVVAVFMPLPWWSLALPIVLALAGSAVAGRM